MSKDPSGAAPGRLELVRKFVNTEDLHNDRDALADTEGTLSWLTEAGLLASGEGINDPELDALRGLRASLRELAAANTEGGEPPAATLEVFNEAVRPHAASVRLGAEEGRVVASLSPHESGAGGVIAALATAVQEAALTGAWARLKACANPECSWLFYDASRSRTGRWCSMGACGSVSKARAYRARQRRRASEATE
jgi:predicted RNA-binding Zn ribbon-like protein